MDIIVGTAGHIDHGKTSLVKSLTGTDTDRLPEEKKRGITIDIGFAELELGRHHIGFVDVPGHEKFVKNMLAGASGIDIVLLVVAADEGVMPQTREHFDICKLLGIKAGVIALTKADLADDETRELARLEVSELVADSFLETAQVISVSSRTGEGIDKLKKALEAAADRVPERRDEFSVHLPIDRSFAVKGFGTVVTGTLSSGEIAANDELELLPKGRRVRVRGLQSHGLSAEKARSGLRVAVNLGGIDHADISRGELLATPDALRPTQIINAEVEVLLGSPRPLLSRQRARVHIGTAEILARVQVLNDFGEIPPGSRDFVRLRLESPTAARLGDRFIIRSYSPQITIAGGKVLDPLAEKLRKSEFPRTRETLTRLTDTSVSKSDVAIAYVEAAGKYGAQVSDILARTGWRKFVLEEAVSAAIESRSVTRVGERLVGTSYFTELKSQLITQLETHHNKEPLSKGMSRESLRGPHLPSEIYEGLVGSLKAENKIDVFGDTVSIAAKKANLSPDDEVVRSRIMKRLADSGLQVPKTHELIADAVAGTKTQPAHAMKILFLLFDSGDAVKISEDLVFASTVIEDLIAKIREHANRGDRTIDVPKFKDIAGVSRKYAIPLLEYFDREKVTLRAGDKRVIR